MQAGETDEEWRGLSTFDSPVAARAMLLRVPRFPLRLLARLEVPDDAPVQIRKTHGLGHLTAWGEPSVLLDAVASVMQIDV